MKNQNIKQLFNALSHAGTKNLTSLEAKRVNLINNISLLLGLISVFFFFYWIYHWNMFLILNNAVLALVYAGVIYLNHKGFYNIPKYLLIFFVSTPLFFVSGMWGKASNIHFSLIPIAGFSALLFDRKQRLHILFAMAYPTLLLAILIFSNFSVFSQVAIEKPQILPVWEYSVNFLVIVSTMFCLYRFYINAETKYQDLYEKHVKTQKQLDEDRARSIHSAKMVALGEMSGGIAHEINGPLFVIQTHSSLLISDLPLKSLTEQEVEEKLNKINKTCLHIVGIIKSLSAISRCNEDDPMQRVCLSTLIQETLILCQHRFYLKSITIAINCPKDLPRVMCRPVEISQVLINLLNNAYDAVQDVPEPQVNISVSQQVGKLMITVEDNGVGVPEKVQSKVFETFFTTKDVGKGTGLGLSISKKLIERNNGQLELKSSPGRTVFTFDLCIA